MIKLSYTQKFLLVKCFTLSSLLGKLAIFIQLLDGSPIIRYKKEQNETSYFKDWLVQVAKNGIIYTDEYFLCLGYVSYIS